MMTVNVNGEDRRLDEVLTVAGLLRTLGVKAAAVAVEINRAIVPRGEHETRRLEEGDRVEIVTFVGGG